ncbi:hypothetical protein GCM10009745_74930 [Kribbella yunnanensis]|uniref:Uncharacterized protein n=1 Tax=Kribbella yunnanensis TaxID=190194 RepID=A0ABP4V0H5_9ACTN
MGKQVGRQLGSPQHPGGRKAEVAKQRLETRLQVESLTRHEVIVDEALQAAAPRRGVTS